MKQFIEVLSEKINANFVGFRRPERTMVGYSAKSNSFVEPEPDHKGEKKPFIDQHKPDKPDPLASRGMFHLYNKSSKQVTSKTQPFKKKVDAESYLSTLAQRSREHLKVVYHDKSGGWHDVGDNGILNPVSLKVLNKPK